MDSVHAKCIVRVNVIAIWMVVCGIDIQITFVSRCMLFQYAFATHMAGCEDSFAEFLFQNLSEIVSICKYLQMETISDKYSF
jgi:hypothetical protein